MYRVSGPFQWCQAVGDPGYFAEACTECRVHFNGVKPLATPGITRKRVPSVGSILMVSSRWRPRVLRGSVHRVSSPFQQCQAVGDPGYYAEACTECRVHFDDVKPLATPGITRKRAPSVESISTVSSRWRPRVLRGSVYRVSGPFRWCQAVGDPGYYAEACTECRVHFNSVKPLATPGITRKRVPSVGSISMMSSRWRPRVLRGSVH